MSAITVFWDMIGCPVWTDNDPSLVFNGLNHALAQFQIFGTILIYGYGEKSQFSNLLDTNLRKAGIRMTWLRKCDQSKEIFKVMNQIMCLKFDLEAIDTSLRRPVTKVVCVLMSSEENYASLFHKLSRQGHYETFLVHPHADPRSLSQSCLVRSCQHLYSYGGLLQKTGPC